MIHYNIPLTSHPPKWACHLSLVIQAEKDKPVSLINILQGDQGNFLQIHIFVLVFILSLIELFLSFHFKK